MRDFEAFFKVNKNKIMGCSKSNTRYNKDGLAAISKKDDWFYDDVWELDFKGIPRIRELQEELFMERHLP